MNKIIAFLFLFIFIGTVNVFGQLSVGGKLGGASTNLTGIGMKDFIPDPKVKFIGGAIINYAIGNRIGLQTEILYSGKGSAFKYYYEDKVRRGVLQIEQKLGYLSIPLMIQLKMGDRFNYFHFDGGIVTNYLLHESFTGIIDLENDKGLVANGLNFDFRYEVGTKQVFQSDEGSPSILNKAFQVSVGYTIRPF